MKILLVQFSDIHFKKEDNAILEKEAELFDAIKNATLEYDKIFLTVCGDTAFSGQIAEYELANKFINDLKTKIETYSKKQVICIIIPGNHDCDFTKDNKSRQNQVNLIQKVGDPAIDDSVIEQCVKIQEDYFSFSQTNQETPVFSNNLFSSYVFDFDAKKVVFYCYNTAYISELNEQAGKLFFPISQIPDFVYQNKADLLISLFHHPFHWLCPTNRREFSMKIHETSDFYMTGHEHTSSKSKIDDLDANVVYHIEGSVLQDSNDRFESEFGLIGIDLEKECFKIDKYYWTNRKYHPSSEAKDWINYNRGKNKWKNKYNITFSFQTFLEDVGGKFTHPYKSDINLSDVFLYPKLRSFNTKGASDDHTSYIVQNSESLIKSFTTNSKVLFLGGENIGKSSLLKTCFTVLYKMGYVPVYVRGQEIRSPAIEDLKKVVSKAFADQYGADSVDAFTEEDIEKVFILIDDIDKTAIKNQKSKGRLIRTINTHYRNVVLVGNELYAIEEIVSDEQVSGDLYSTFEQFEILEFNHSMRVKLIQRWYTLGREDIISDGELLKKCDNAVRAIDIAMGYRIVPNYPLFLLILLQAVETSNPHDLQISSYGNYYQLLILKAFTESIKDQSDLNTYQNYCTELAYHFFSKRISSLSQTEYNAFHRYVTSYENFDLPNLSADRALATLTTVGVIHHSDDLIEFKYQYTYYYFVAKYLAQNIERPEIREIISKLIARLYRTEFANILMFLIHFSRNEFIIDELLKNTRAVFNDLPPCKLENDVQQLHSLVAELPKLYLKAKSVSDVREEENQRLDRQEEEEAQKRMSVNLEKDLSSDFNEDTSHIDIVSRLNLSFKLMEILGQIIKNNYGAMSGPIKNSMMKETYLIGLRTLNVFFTVFNENTDFILNQMKDSLSKYEKVSEDKVEKTARQLLFAISSQLSYVFIKKISDSVGSSRLMDKYERVQEDLNFSSVKLINYLIKLDHAGSFPGNDLYKIKDSFERFPLAYYALKRMVVNHLHRNHIDHRNKQRVCQFLGIPMESQLKIEAMRKREDEKEKE